jgi:hypothetical protein
VNRGLSQHQQLLTVGHASVRLRSIQPVHRAISGRYSRIPSVGETRQEWQLRVEAELLLD